MVNGSLLLRWSFILLAFIVAGGFVAAVRSASRAVRLPSHRISRDTLLAAICTAAWLSITALLAASGRLSFTTVPPTEGIVIAVGLAIAIGVGVSPLGYRVATGLPLFALVGAQAFRFPLELLLHRAYVEGLMPVQMSYSGFNLDILSGLSAIVVSLQLVRKPASLIAARIWNAGAVVLLVNIVTIALLSAPTRFRFFQNEPANVWITRAPWVWLPTVFVVAAALGHVLVFRRLRYEARAVAALQAS